MDKESHETEQGLRHLVNWAANMQLADIPSPVVRRAALVIADDLAAVVASRNEPEVACVHQGLLKNDSKAEATVFRGGRPRTDRYSAAVANGAAADWAELDEGYRKAVCHAGLYCLPALLAEAEAVGASVNEVLRCCVVSYEITTRFARVWKFPALTLHPHGIFNAVGAAAAVSLLRGLNPATFMSALTSSATLIAVGPFDHAVKGALIRNMWPAAGAWNGMRAVDWAQCGIGGLPSTPNDVYAGALGAQPHPKELTDELGKEWAISDGYHKMFACCQYSHSTVEAALSLLANMSGDRSSRNIKKIIVETHPSGLTLNNYDPPTTLAAKFSIPYIVAATFVTGQAGADAFSANRLHDPEITRLRKLTELRSYEPIGEWPNDRPARVSVEFQDGSTMNKECLSAAGGPDKPFSQKQIIAKIRLLTGEIYPEFANTLTELIELKPSVASLSWDQIVAKLVGEG